MTEHDLEKACMEVLRRELPRSIVWKICDRETPGQPDLEVAWNGHTTKIEFKFMKRGEHIHQKWEDPRQLVTCIKYEQATARCWIVAYQKEYGLEGRERQTLIYRPVALMNGKIPVARTTYDGFAIATALALWEDGVVSLSGYNHHGIAGLIQATHK